MNRIVISSSFLRAALADLITANDSVKVQVLMSPEAPFFSMQVEEETSSSEISFPRESSSEIYSTFDCSKTLKFAYKLSAFRACVRALGRSDKVNLRMNSVGILQLQAVISGQAKENAAEEIIQSWIDFMIRPEESQDDL